MESVDYHNLEGELWLARGDSARAKDSFLAAVREYQQYISHIGLARSLESQMQWNSSIAEWQAVLAAWGEILQNGFPPDLVIAHLALARIYRQINDAEHSRDQYEEVLRSWEDADDLIQSGQARRELRQLIATAKH